MLYVVLHSAVEDIPLHEKLFVLMDANVRTGKRGGGCVGSKDNVGAYRRDILDDYGEHLLNFSANHGSDKHILQFP